MTLAYGGLARLGGGETGRTCWIDSGDAGFRARYHEAAVQRESDLQRAFLRAGVDWVNISTAEDDVYPLVKLFKQRG